MPYLTAVLIPPLYFLTRQKWLGCIVSSLLLILSLFLFMSVVLIPVALVFWGLCSIVAVWDLRKRLMDEQATMIATKMAAEMRSTQIPPKDKP